MRVDVCGTEALKALKDKAGGKRFSRDFEDGSTKLQDFVTFLDRQVKKGPSLMETLENADIFYEMQYKEVKIVTKAYQIFANRVLHLKRKLDALKASLPDLNDSPIPSPSEDAPSPIGSESSFHGLHRIGTPDPELDGQAMEEDLIACDAPSPLSSSSGDKDNRDLEDMELSDVEDTEGPAIIVEEQLEQPGSADVSNVLPDPEPSPASQAAHLKQVTTPAATETPTTGSLPITLASVDLGKIGSILSTLSNVMKNSGLSSFLNTRTGMTSAHSLARGSNSQRSDPLCCTQSPNIVQTRGVQKEAKKGSTISVTSVISSLDSKIDYFLQGNRGMRSLNMDFPSVLPWPKAIDGPTVNLGGTPVRDESGATPTQDEVMDSTVVQPLLCQGGPCQTASTTSSLADSSAPTVVSGLCMATYANKSWQEKTMHSSHFVPGAQNGGELYQRDFAVKQDFQSSIPLFAESEMGHQQVKCVPQSSLAANNTSSTENSAAMRRNASISEGVTAYPGSGNAVDKANLADNGWYGKTHRDTHYQHVMAISEAYRRDQCGSKESVQDFSPPNFFSIPLPPIPQLPPPPQDFLPQVVDGAKDHTELPDSFNNMQDSSEGQGCIPANLVGFDDFDERISYQIQGKEPFHPLQSVPGPWLRDAVPRLVLPNSPVDYSHRARIPMHHQNYPNMSHHSLSPHFTLKGYHERLSPSSSPSEDPYFDPYYEPTAQSPSPPLYDAEHSLSPPSQMYYAEDRALPPHHPEHGLPPHLELRPPCPPHYRAPCPGYYLPQRPPCRRPPPYPNELPYLRGKRHDPPFGGALHPGGPYFPPTRPFLPPRY